MKLVLLNFDKDKTTIVKGIAILLMIVLHCGNQSWYTIDLNAFSTYPYLGSILGNMKFCVGIFTFLVGYGYAFSKSKDFRYSVSHIFRLLTAFWVVLLITVPFALIRGEFRFDLLLLNMIGVNSTYNYFSWFVAFYIYAMVVMPLISRVLDKNYYLYTLVFIVLSFGFAACIHKFIPNYVNNDWLSRLFDCFVTTPTLLIGYFFSKNKIYTRLKTYQNKYMIFLYVLLIIATLTHRYYLPSVIGFNLDLIYAPIFIYAVIAILNLYDGFIARIFKILGNYSVYMWFVHALFFTELTRNYFQPLILVSDNLCIIILWTISLTFIMSFVISKIVEVVRRNISLVFAK